LQQRVGCDTIAAHAPGKAAHLATLSDRIQRREPKAWSADGYERLLAAAALLLLAVVLIAIGRGRAHWADASLPIWLHLGTIMIALALTPVMLLRPRGDRLHRGIGWVWSAAMLATALLSFLVHRTDPVRFSFIHILSVWVVIQVPLIVWSARTHNIRRHRRSVRAMVTGALLIAGFFTFPFGRMLGAWLYG
jgi:uncharacterized membrane protein